MQKGTERQPTDLVFEVTSARRPNLEDVLRDLQAFAEAHPPNKRRILDYQYWRDKQFHPHTIQKYFGSWPELLKKAGVEYDRFAATRTAKLDVEADLRRFAEAHQAKDRTARKFEAWKSRKVTTHAVRHYFGNWYSAMIALGFDCPSRSRSAKHSDEQYLEAIETVWRWTIMTRGRSPRRSDFRAYIASHSDGISDAAVVRRFGEFTRFLKAFADWKNGRLSRKQLLALSPSKVVERVPLSRRTRFDVLHAAGNKCQVCGASASDGATLHIDHIVPVSKGGTNATANLRALCDKCNMGRSARYTM